jgi:hypothetical protein
MKIANATLSMQSQHAATAWRQTSESLRATVALPPVVQISEAGKTTQATETKAIDDSADAVEHDPKLLMIRRMIELFTGRAVRVFNPKEIEGSKAAPATNSPPVNASPQGASPNTSVDYRFDEVHQEREATTFSAQGTVQTADGRQIAFQLNLAMARQYREETHIAVHVGTVANPAPQPAKRKDPLVINFAGNAAQLTDQHFQFDLNADGRKESLAMLAAGSGYLALDKNGNGAIDSGNELFGPATGHGFAELAQYDQDGNGWIDENDAIYAKLRVWTPDATNAGMLTTLQDHQVGALYLGELATPFELRGQQNGNLGAVRASGIYLSQNGQAGTLQEIDLTI